MARSASSENIRRDQDGPDYKGTIQLVRGQLRSNDSDQKSLAQDNATIFKRIEKELGVHKGAAQSFASIDKMAPEKRTDYLRSLLGLLNHAGYDNFDDLVDRAQRPGKKSAKAKTPAAGENDQEGDGGEPESGEAESGTVVGKGLAAARKHLGTDNDNVVPMKAPIPDAIS